MDKIRIKSGSKKDLNFFISLQKFGQKSNLKIKRCSHRLILLKQKHFCKDSINLLQLKMTLKYPPIRQIET